MSLSILYGADWVFWEAYNPLQFLGEQKVVFDGLNKLILVSEGVTELDFRVDVYSAWKEWVQDPNHLNAGFVQALTAVGGDPLPGARSLGTTYFLENGWRMRTWEGDHELTVTGNVFTREGDSIFVPTLEPWNIIINLNTSTLVETITLSTTLNTNDAELVANSVWNATIQGANSALDILLSVDEDVWNYIIDVPRNQTAQEKLRKIASKIQDIALQ